MFWLAQNMQIRSHDFFLVTIDVPDKYKAGGTLIVLQFMSNRDAEDRFI